MRSTLVLAGAALLLMSACAPIPSVPTRRAPLPADPGTTPAANTLESQIHDRVNAHRGSRGLAPLEWDPRIAAVAREHSEAMASGRRPFGHDGFEARASVLGTTMTIRSMAENVAYDGRDGARLASQVVDGWIASAGHRQNIEGSFTRTGVGVARGADGTRYFTQVFVDGG